MAGKVIEIKPAIVGQRITAESNIDLRLEVMELIDKGYAQSQISRESGVPRSTLSRWLRGLYCGREERLNNKIEDWVGLVKNRKIAVFSQNKSNAYNVSTPGWIETPTGRNIQSALTYAQTMRNISLIYGGSGVGKSATIKEYAASNPNVWLITVSPAINALHSVLEEIAQAMGLYPGVRRTAYLYRQLAKRLAGTRGLLIIDEAQHLTYPALETIRALHDEAEIGAALVGNEMLYARLTGGIHSTECTQLFSRIGKRLRLTKPLPEDIEALAEAFDLGKEEHKIIAKIAVGPGGLHNVTKILQLASILAASESSAKDNPATIKPQAKRLRLAWADLCGDKR